MDYNPIVIFVYNRKKYLEQTFDALKDCYNVEKHDCFIFCDAYNFKRDKDKEAVEETRAFVEYIKTTDVFRNTFVFYSDIHLGCREATIRGMNYVLNKYEAVIDIEDDIIVSENFLDYMDDALRYFKDRNDICMIAGYSYSIKEIETYKYDSFIAKRLNTWGFGTWADRWKKVDWELKDYDEFIEDDKMKYEFMEGGYDLLTILRQQAEAELDAWDITWMYSMYKMGMMAVYPKISFTQNIGVFGSHYSGKMHEQQRIDLNSKRYDFDNCFFNRTISNKIKEFFMTEIQFLDYKDVIDDKHWRLFRIADQWMKYRDKNICLKQFFVEHKWYTIAIYGAGKMAEHLIYELKDTGIEIVFMMDRFIDKVDWYNGRILKPGEKIPDVDAVVVTPIMDYRNVKKQLKESYGKDIEYVSLESVIMPY